jgi:tetratricopeptide (TPR) repeat protein
MSNLLFVCALALSLFAGKPVDDAKQLLKEKKFEEAVALLEPAHKAKPADNEVKTVLVEALMASGDSYMYNDKLPPFRKYPVALRHYRRVLEIDKDNKKAKDNVAMIEGIYKSMGREVPK